MRSIQGPPRVRTSQTGCVMFSVQHRRVGVEEKAHASAELDLREAERPRPKETEPRHSLKRLIKESKLGKNKSETRRE